MSADVWIEAKACPAAASWVPREGQGRVIHLPTPRTT